MGDIVHERQLPQWPILSSLWDARSKLGREEMERENRRAVYFERDFPSHPQPQG